MLHTNTEHKHNSIGCNGEGFIGFMLHTVHTVYGHKEQAAIVKASQALLYATHKYIVLYNRLQLWKLHRHYATHKWNRLQ
jgi:hypothetical protein